MGSNEATRVCPHCGDDRQVEHISGGVYYCQNCGKAFTLEKPKA